MKSTVRGIVVGLIALALVACQQTDVKTSDLAAKDEPEASGGIAPAGPNIGGMTPVMGSENIGGGSGGGVGQAAKEMAKSRASAASSVAGANSAMGALSGEGE